MASFSSYMAAPLPAGEADRQQAVDRAAPALRRRHSQLCEIVERARRELGTPIAAISIIDRNRQKLVAQVGLEQDETARDVSFCAHAIHRPGELTVVEDAAKDERFIGNPLVTGAPHIRFYAGKPLMSHDGFALGTLCVIDTQPRDDPGELVELTLLAREVEKVIGA